jgi:hypothetical protein
MKKPSGLRGSLPCLLLVSWLLAGIGSVHGAELVSPSITESKPSEMGSSPNNGTPLDDLRESWAKLKDELTDWSEDSELLSILLERALTEASELQSLLTLSMEQSENLKTLSEDLARKLEAQDKAHRAEIVSLEISRGVWIVGTVTVSAVAISLGVAWLLK